MDGTGQIKVVVVGYLNVSGEGELHAYDAMTVKGAAHNQQRWYDEGTITAPELVSLLDELESVTITSGEIKEGDRVRFTLNGQTMDGSVLTVRTKTDDETYAIVAFRYGSRERRTVRNVKELRYVPRARDFVRYGMNGTNDTPWYLIRETVDHKWIVWDTLVGCVAATGSHPARDFDDVEDAIREREYFENLRRTENG